MRLSLTGNSKNNIGYIPDTLIKINFENEKGENCYLALDIEGWTDYDRNNLSCYTKGEFLPWVYGNSNTNKEIDLTSYTEEQIEAEWSVSKIEELLQNVQEIMVFLYPVKKPTTEAEKKALYDDVISDCSGTIELTTGNPIAFSFHTELNYC